MSSSAPLAEHPPASAVPATAEQPDPRSLKQALWMVAGLLVLYIPTCWYLANNDWQLESQGHEPLILALAYWLLWSDRNSIFAGTPRPALISGFVTLSFGLVAYAIGRSQAFITLEVGSQIFVLAGALLLIHGWSALRYGWFPLFFMIFMVPLPSAIVQAITTPLKAAVSHVAEYLLYVFNYPIARTGVVLSIGQYQLMVADACAGLNSMFTLESLGLLYMRLMNYQSPVRNTVLALSIIPISFFANVIRVIVLVLVTYYFGDAAGQGFTHWFAGMVLFVVALTTIFIIDKPLGWLFENERRSHVHA